SDVTLARMVMPRSRSISLLSMARSSTRSFSRNEPDCLSSTSISVVLPWSTWAIIAILRKDMLGNRQAEAGPGKAGRELAVADGRLRSDHARYRQAPRSKGFLARFAGRIPQTHGGNKTFRRIGGLRRRRR